MRRLGIVGRVDRGGYGAKEVRIGGGVVRLHGVKGSMIGPERAYIVLTLGPDKSWNADWDGEVHPTRADADAALADAALALGEEAVCLRELIVPRAPTVGDRMEGETCPRCNGDAVFLDPYVKGVARICGGCLFAFLRPQW